MASSVLVEGIQKITREEQEACLKAMQTLRAHLPILFHLLPLTTVTRALMNELEKKEVK